MSYGFCMVQAQDIYNIGAKETDFRGVIPNHQVEYRDALNFTMELIKKQQTSKKTDH